MTESARHLRPVEAPPELRLVNADTGETFDLAAHVQELQDQIAGLQRDIRGWASRYGELKRDRQAEAEESPVWPAALRVFDYWRQQCRHPRSEWTLDRFEMIRPHLERSNTGKGKAAKLTPDLIARNEEICKLAVDGIAFDPYTTVGKNGRQIVHDGLHLVFGDTDALEKRCKMAPAERIREVFPPRSEQQTLDTRQDPQ